MDYRRAVKHQHIAFNHCFTSVKTMQLPFTVVIPDIRCNIPKFSNLNLLEISLTMFFLFVLAEVCGAVLSNSLSLLGDAASMGIDVMTYVCNIYGEWAKNSNQRPTVRSRLILEVIIPGLSTIALLAITIYICLDAVNVLRHPPATNDVNTNYLYGFAATNLCIDLLCGTLFYMRGEEVFVESNSLPKLSLDTSVTFDQVLLAVHFALRSGLLCAISRNGCSVARCFHFEAHF